MESKESKKDLGIKIGMDWNTYKNVGRIFILTELIRPIEEIHKGDHCIRLCFTWFIRVRTFSLQRLLYFLVIVMPR